MINNSFYEQLEDQWYKAKNHPIALLRAENRIRAPWVISETETRLGNQKKVLDIGCGGGFLSNCLAQAGHQVIGIDLSKSSLEIAKKHDETKSVHYQEADAYALPFADKSFDVVCAMDILEHVEHPQKLIEEASRVLRVGGLFFFHTFNRNFLSYLIVIKGIDWFVKNAPKNIHVYNLFIKPEELTQICHRNSLKVVTMQGLRPCFSHPALWKMLMSGCVSDQFQFTFSKQLSTGYCGLASKSI